MENTKPPFRKLRGYAFDPSLSLQLDNAVINDVIYKVDWEKVEKGPIGEYIEVIDYDPSTGYIYTPVDLNEEFCLVMDGLDPSESNPKFHQQMVYAVCMTTIKNFELALGRKAMWSPRRIKSSKLEYEKQYIQRLRIYPHALREPNAYYSPQKKSLLFGYFSADPENVTLHMPGGLVFTCLSHDIISHETSHALLDGMHSSYTTPTNSDVLAFHEAFADIVALFQHFTFPEVLKHQIAKTKGNLESQNLLGQLAQEFGKAIGMYGSLRDAIGEINENTKQWELKKPDPSEYANTIEPHSRGSILVAAIFDAFLNIYKNRIADLLRISTGGSGVLPEGELHPDLVNRLANEASKSAGHVLKMCIRALDYCPAIDITFGDYLRAIITADADLIEDDSRDYRLAFIDAFRKRGIYPEGIKTLSVESLIYKAENFDKLYNKFSVIGRFLREFREMIIYETDRKKIFEITNSFISGGQIDNDSIMGLHERISSKFEDSIEFGKLTGLVFTDGWKALGIKTSMVYGLDSPTFQVYSLNLANRVGPQGKIINHIILTLIQKSGVVCQRNPNDESELIVNTFIPNNNIKLPEKGFEFRGSCTLIFDLDSLDLKYVISKPLLDINILREIGIKELNKKRISKQYQFMFEDNSQNDLNISFRNNLNMSSNEPFAILHSII